MKVLIIYYSQSGNTLLIARHIEKGLRKAGAERRVSRAGRNRLKPIPECEKSAYL